MKIRIERGLAYVEAVLTFRGRSLCLGDTILDTGSASTIFSADRLLEIGVVPEPLDALHRLRGIGGTEYAFTKRLEPSRWAHRNAPCLRRRGHARLLS